MSARDGQNLDHLSVFHEGCVDTRLKELTQYFIGQFATEEMRQMAMEQRKAFKQIDPYPFNQEEVRQKFFDRAKLEAEKILEQERQNLVDFKSDYIKTVLTQAVKSLNQLVYDSTGAKYKMLVEKAVSPDPSGRWDSRDIVYVGDHNFALLDLIGKVSGRIKQFNDYRPYLSEELKALFQEADSLSSLEIVRIEKVQKSGKSQKTETS
jgi:hypothetical protein